MPYYRYQLHLHLAPQVVADRIRAVTREPPGFWDRPSWWSGDKPVPPFLGRVDEHSFRVRRDIHYTNAFLPRIRGQISPIPGGSTVRVTMHLHPFVAAFEVLWLSFTGFFALIAVANSFAGFVALRTRGDTGGPDGLPALIPLAMFVFGIALTCGAFFPEAMKAKRLLETAVGKRGA
jgi:hypothetical protein